MVSRILFLEGADTNRRDDIVACRKAFKELLLKVSPNARHTRVEPCGSRDIAFKEFKKALGDPDLLPFLLVDSEEIVDQKHSGKPWDHLKDRDKWTRPANATDDQAQLMAVEIETWIASDIEVLKSYYGKDFAESALAGARDLEQVTKPQINDHLKRATKKTAKGEYHKTRHGHDLVAQVRPGQIRCRCPNWAGRFFDQVASW